MGFARENPNTEIVGWVGFANPTCPADSPVGRILVSDKAQTATHLAVMPNVGFKNPTYIQDKP
ncbi:hypothetical protein [Neisseria sicca]|uniref:hypothetical protein n=1 Tax=Neisseria sicca TaxID=490 RepID=UPI000D2FC7E7|nr:hypothetical protein [Neisseria sicca]